MTTSAWDTDEAVVAAGYVLAPEGRYIDPEHGIDWAVIVWRCPDCERVRSAPGPGQPPHCVLHGRMTPVRSACRARARVQRTVPGEWAYDVTQDGDLVVAIGWSHEWREAMRRALSVRDVYERHPLERELQATVTAVRDARAAQHPNNEEAS